MKARTTMTGPTTERADDAEARAERTRAKLPPTLRDLAKIKRGLREMRETCEDRGWLALSRRLRSALGDADDLIAAFYRR